jgi:predicted GNAT superfamily acetyltransferase
VVLNNTASPQFELPLEVRELTTTAEFEMAVSLFCRVWSADTPTDLVNTSTLRAWSMSDNYVAGMYLDAEMAGAAVGFRGDGHLHSHLVGVLPGLQGKGYGSALKAHQLCWGSSRGLTSVRWTFDPLLRRNAHLNLRKLGATVRSFEPNLYGRLQDGLNDDDETDRLVVEWTERTAHTPETAAAEVLGRPTPDMEARVFDEGEASVRTDDGSVMLIATPENFDRARMDHYRRASRWRVAVRDAFANATALDFECTGFTPDGWYVLRRRG